jgi:hypothetical protein
MEKNFEALLRQPRERLVSELCGKLSDNAEHCGAGLSAAVLSIAEALPEGARLSYLTLSFLHTELLKGNPPYLVEAFDEAWFLEKPLAQSSYDASWAVDAWRRYEGDAWRVLRKNGQSPPETVFRAHISKDLALVRFAVQGMSKYAIPDAEEAFAPYAAESGIYVSIGGYRGKQTVIARFAAPPADMGGRPDVAFSVKKDWTFTRFGETVFENIDFGGVDFSGAHFENCRFYDCRFSDSKINDAVFSDCAFEKTVFDDCTLYGTAFGAEFTDTLFRGSNAGTWDPLKANGFFVPSLWRDCRANGVTWEDCDFSGADFDNCSFPGAVRTGSDFRGTIFEDAPEARG